MLVSILLCDIEMHSTSTALNSRGQDQLVTLAQRSLGLNVLKSETSR